MIRSALPATWRAPWLSTSLTLWAFAIDRFHWDLALRRDAVLHGELFRLVTGHFAHFNQAHLFGDALAFAFWAACIEQRGRAFLASTLMVTTIGSSLFFVAFCPEVAEYRGLSALDCALATQIIVIGWADRRRARDTMGATLFGGAGLVFFTKTLFEFWTGHAVLAPDLGESVSLLPASHVAGVVLGLTCLGLQFAGEPHTSQAMSVRCSASVRRTLLCFGGIVHRDRSSRMTARQ